MFASTLDDRYKECSIQVWFRFFRFRFGSFRLKMSWQFERLSAFFFQHPLDCRPFVITEVWHLFQRLDNASFKIPASHLSERQPSGKFISRNIFFSLANMPGNIECLAHRKFAVVENGSCSCRFLGFAFCAPAWMWRFTWTAVCVSAFTADKSFGPF